MNNKQSSCARNRNVNGTVIFYARKHAVAAPAQCPDTTGRVGIPSAEQVFFPHGPQPLERAAEVS